MEVGVGRATLVAFQVLPFWPSRLCILHPTYNLACSCLLQSGKIHILIVDEKPDFFMRAILHCKRTPSGVPSVGRLELFSEVRHRRPQRLLLS